MRYAIALAALLAATSPAGAAPITLSGSGDQWFQVQYSTGGIDIIGTFTVNNPPQMLSMFDFGGPVPQQWTLNFNPLGNGAEWSGATGHETYYLDLTGTQGGSWSLEFHGALLNDPLIIDS